MGQARGIFSGAARGISRALFSNRNRNLNLNRFYAERLGLRLRLGLGKKTQNPHSLAINSLNPA
jgi:hypothetical protein